MYTIIDYLNYYKDTTVKYVKLNSQDFLIFACLSYLPLDSFGEEKNLQEFVKYSVKFKDRLHGGNTGSLAYQLLKVMVKSKRYQDLKIENFVGKRDDFVQFGAMTFVLGKNKIISFRGSDRSFVSWVENARMFYQYPTNTQKMGIDYLKNAIYKDDDNV